MLHSPLPDQPVAPDWTAHPTKNMVFYKSPHADVWAIRKPPGSMRYVLRWKAHGAVKEKRFHDRRTMMREFVKRELKLISANTNVSVNPPPR